MSDPVAELWERFRPLVRERIDLLAAFVAGDPGLAREDAARAAHNLAGSLGSYGRTEAGLVARSIDQAFLTGTGDRADELAPLVAELRTLVDA